jgi:hypothetical protein
MAPRPIEDTLTFLLGEWSLARKIDDHRAGTAGQFTGRATVTRAGAAGLYNESGVISFGAHHGPAGRRLRLVPTPAGTVDVRFADDRPFFELDLTGWGVCTADHPCVDDMYVISFEAVDAHTLKECWQVRGPEKDYDALTVWDRLASGLITYQSFGI